MPPITYCECRREAREVRCTQKTITGYYLTTHALCVNNLDNPPDFKYPQVGGNGPIIYYPMPIPDGDPTCVPIGPWNPLDDWQDCPCPEGGVVA